MNLRTAVLGTALMLGGSSMALAQSDAQGNPQSGTGAGPTAQQANPSESFGVVQKVDRTGHMLTLIVPTGESISVQKGAGLTEVSRETDMVSLNVPVAASATVMRSGQNASFDQLKMGDSVRVSFDPTQKAITRIEAQPLSTQKSCMGQMGGQMRTQPNPPPSEQP